MGHVPLIEKHPIQFPAALLFFMKKKDEVAWGFDEEEERRSWGRGGEFGIRSGQHVGRLTALVCGWGVSPETGGGGICALNRASSAKALTWETWRLRCPWGLSLSSYSV